MKKLNKFGFILFLAVTSILSSCSSDDSDGGSGGFSGPSTGTFVKAKIGSTNLLAEGDYANGGYNSGNLVLQGFSTTTGKSVNIQLYAIDGSLEVGTYAMDLSNNEDNYVGSLSLIDVDINSMSTKTYNSSFCDDSNGTLEITFIDATKIEGTFSFKGKELLESEDCSGGTKNVTNGSFRLEIGS
ncbi:hypothetical protein [Flavobacterium sp.]|uniref:hypothetical protein n=1 Tax=Flavobacterium sp. TaxID=239 RepID=UPI00263223C6|nr:hypothetical protein [Flavobacterium sp.]